MLIIRGVNVFPSQVETVLTSISGATPHFMMVVERAGSTDSLEIQVEATEELFADTVGQMQALQKKIIESMKSTLGLSAEIKLVAPKTIPRFEGQGPARDRQPQAVILPTANMR
jgi:phenylacetate-CoA ligase